MIIILAVIVASPEADSHMKRKLKAGMVGGGRDAFIGGVHRMAMRLDGKIELVAGAFSSNAEKSRLSGEDLLLDPKRVYPDYRTMVEQELQLPIGERIDFVSIVTPNRTHVPVARAFLEAGFNVVCDKPLAFNLEEALELQQVVQQDREGICVDAQLYRLSDGQGSSRTCSQGRAGRTS